MENEEIKPKRDKGVIIALIVAIVLVLILLSYILFSKDLKKLKKDTASSSSSVLIEDTPSKLELTNITESIANRFYEYVNIKEATNFDDLRSANMVASDVSTQIKGYLSFKNIVEGNYIVTNKFCNNLFNEGLIKASESIVKTTYENIFGNDTYQTITEEIASPFDFSVFKFDETDKYYVSECKMGEEEPNNKVTELIKATKTDEKIILTEKVTEENLSYEVNYIFTSDDKGFYYFSEVNNTKVS